jgi:hypothetical protein
VRVGDRVQTDDGPGTIVSVWQETGWAFGVPRRYVQLVVQLDEGGGVWRRMYLPDEVGPLVNHEEEEHEWPA